ncbi:hypothetical protein AB6A40_006236 [Gnathostoma spinigerum]|uniref:Uncharacterized protein n=1 Tax=Gnathostoma spinigerum TaxID=75299 RepID=A0ABD6EJZ3_9BILA
MGRRHSHKGPRSTETPAVNGKANSSAKKDVHEKILEGIEAENSAFSVFKNSEKANTAEGDLSARAGNQTGKLLASEARKKKKRNDGLNEKPRILAYPGYKRSPKKAKKRMSDGSKPNESNIVEDCSVPNGDSSKRKRKKRRAEPTESESGSFDSSTIKRSKGAKPFNVLSSVVMAAESSKADKNSSKVVHKKTFKKVINGKVVEYVNETEVQNPPKDERRNKMNKEILESQNDEEEPIIFEDVQLVDVGGNENLSQSVSDHYDVENEGEVESIEGEEVEDEDSETEDETEEDENEGELEGMEFIDDEAVECSDAEEEDEGEEEEDDDDDEDEEEEAEATKVADMNEFIEEHCIIYGPKDCKDSQKTIDFSDMPFSKFPNSVQNAMDAWSWITSPCEVKEFFE